MSGPRPWLAAGGPDAPALVLDGRPVGAAELAARADALAGWLTANGVERGETVAALLAGGLSFATLLHALDRCDAALLPLNLRLTPRELAFQLRDAGAGRLLHDGGPRAASAAAAAREAGGVVPVSIPDEPPAGAAPASDGDLSAPLAVLYTSGTTGAPKGAVLAHRAFLASARASAQQLGAGPGDRWLACLPLFHVGGLSILLRGALHGCCVVVHSRFDADAVSAALDSDAITHVSLVPTLLARLLEVRGTEPAPSTLRCALLGGGPAPPALLERAASLGWPLAPTYGLTEAASQVATLPPGRGGHPVRDGLEPLPGTELRILAEGGDDPAPGQPGEILVRSASLMSGYLNRAEETRLALREGWLHTGDVGRLDARGRLFVLDRRRDLIVSGGENVYPAEVESALLEHPDVLEAGVAGVPDPDYGRRPAAWLVLRPGRAPEADALARFCRARLAGYKIPVRFEPVESLPRNAAGKLLRHRLDAWGGEPGTDPTPAGPGAGSTEG
jgi:O-succinylbenzoic acid--CoA ligase